MAVRVIAKVADAYKLDKKTKRVFHKWGAVAFDDRILRYGQEYVSIRTWTGRQQISFTTGERDRQLLNSRRGESDLVYRQGKWYLLATINVSEPPLAQTTGFLGLDLGITRLATDSDGQSFTGAHVRSLRRRHRKLRARLQRKGTRSARRRLRDRRRKESRFAKDVNHRLSKEIVAKAKRTNRTIVLEDLTGIRSRVRATKAQRTLLVNWAFCQLRRFVEYKAKLAGVPVVAIDPANTSRECAECGHVCQANRRSPQVFKCRQCGHARHADVNAARVIASRAAVNRPNADRSDSPKEAASRLTLGGGR